MKVKTYDNEKRERVIVGTKKHMIQTYGEEKVQYWLDNVQMENLWNCLGAVSNASFGNGHREHHLSAQEYVLQADPYFLYRSVTYGVSPNQICTHEIGQLTNQFYGNFDIAMFLVREKISELKRWLLDNHTFTEREKRLLHYFNNE